MERAAVPGTSFAGWKPKGELGMEGASTQVKASWRAVKLLRRTCLLGLANFLGWISPVLSDSVAFAQVEGMRTASGLQCRVAASDALVHDAFSLTTDGASRPVVSGPGYIRTLIDENLDGVYDRGVDWLRVEQGAQGLYREKNQLYYVADGGLWKSVDSNGDLRGDGRPEKLLTLSTGGEHDAHAIRRGPDGYWYLTNGNFSTATMRSLLNDKDSPVANPKMGLIWRISPDFKSRSVWAHGLRNTYDFDFLPNGEIVTYDSDEEREMSLPAYRPTRVYLASPGSDGGWVSSSWIENDSHLTMPLNLSSLGRGSPTGVCTYQHDALGDRFRDAVLVLDWTFGRVIAVYPERKAIAVDKETSFAADGVCKSEVILEPTGTAGFAPTDVTVTANGDVLVVTGGRGTLGTLYRITRETKPVSAEQADAPDSRKVVLTAQEEPASDGERIAKREEPSAVLSSEAIDNSTQDATTDDAQTLQFFVDEKLTQELPAQRAAALRKILLANCPWEAWSKAEWQPLVNAETSADLLGVLSGDVTIKDGSAKERPAYLRLRAAQVLVHTQSQIPGTALVSAIKSSPNDDVHAAVWYALGHGRVNAQQAEIQAIYEQSLQRNQVQPLETKGSWAAVLGDYTTRARWEAIGLRHWVCTDANEIEEPEFSVTRSNIQLKTWAISRQANDAKLAESFTRDVAMATYMPNPLPVNRVDAGAFDRLAQAIRGGKYKSNPLEISIALGFVQKALGDPRLVIDGSRNPDAASVLDGYRSQRSEAIAQNVRTGWAKYCLNMADYAKQQAYPLLEEEAVRTVAFFRSDSTEVLDRLLARFDAQSHPTADINVLSVIAASAFRPSPEQSAKLADAYANVPEKILVRGMPTDNRWTTRQQQLLEALAAIDGRFMTNLIASLAKSNAQSLEWVDWLPLPQQREAAGAIAKRLIASEAKSWTSSQIQMVGRFVLPPDLASKIRSTAVATIDSPLRNESSQEPGSDDSNASLLVEFLAKTPTTADYEAFVLATASSNRLLLKQGWSGLRKLPIQDAPREFEALSLLLASNRSLPIEGVDVNQVVARLGNIASRMKITPPPSAKSTWEVWQSYLEPQLNTAAVKSLWEELQKPPAAWTELVKQSQAVEGNEDRGAVLFKRGQCNQCHNGVNSIGPSLNGVTRRFSKEDLFRAIYEPSRDISDRFRATKILTSSGQIVTGMVTFDGKQEISLTLADGSTQKIAVDDIEERAESSVSLMPENLLQGWNPTQIADLYTYLQTL